VPRLPSPCIDVCKYKLRGHCIGCGMTKPQKAMAERLHDADAMADFIAGLRAQQESLGRPFWGWEGAYRQKCTRQGAPCPLDAPSGMSDDG
jgi:predicted Fe-S protein YdhL (DUF1289 family)